MVPPIRIAGRCWPAIRMLIEATACARPPNARSALAGFEARVQLIDHERAAAAADDLRSLLRLHRTERVAYLHCGSLPLMRTILNTDLFPLRRLGAQPA